MKQIVSTVLDDLNADDNKGRVILLTGPWGAGKTHLWQHSIKPALKSPHIEASLFGCESIDEIKRRLIFAMLRETVGEVRQFPGRSLLAAGIKAAVKAADSAFGTNVLAQAPDPVDFIEDGIIICIDDIDRAAPDLDVAAILGLVDSLSELKSARILLILDEDKLQSRNSTGAETLRVMSERVISRHLRVDSNLIDVYDAVAGTFKNRDFLSTHRDTILFAFKAAKESNLRTLRRALGAIDESVGIGESLIADRVVLLLTGLIIDRSRGILAGPELYRDAQMMAAASRVGNGSSDATAGTDFYQRYFRESHVAFQWVEAFYEFVRDGYLDRDGAIAELDPQSKNHRPALRLIQTVNSGEAFLNSDEENKAWVTAATKVLQNKDTPMSAFEAVTLLVHGSAAIARSGHDALLGPLKLAAQGRLLDAARIGDDSFDRLSRTHFGHYQRSVWLPLVNSYDDALDSYRQNQLITTARDILSKRDLASLASSMRDNTDMIRTIIQIHEAELLPLRATHRRFFFQALHLLCAFAYGRLLRSDAPYIALHESVARARDADGFDHSDRIILTNMLLEIPLDSPEVVVETQA